MSELKLVAHHRTLTGRKVSQLRRAGLVPVIVYGNVKEPVNLQVETRSLEAMLHAGGATRVVEVTVQDGGKHNVLVKNVHREPIHHKLLHADFYAVNMSEKQRVGVPVVGVGKPSGLAAGLMQLQLHEIIHIEALPADIPAEIEIDISPLTLERPITVADLPVLKGITYVDHAEEVIFNLQHTKEETPDEAVAAEDAAEPEVLKRAKPADED
jgi:large subunit ribosomal protein L25